MLSDIINALQAQVSALQALESSLPQFTQADIDAAIAKGVAQGLAQAAAVLGADVNKLVSDVAGLNPAPAAPQS